MFQIVLLLVAYPALVSSLQCHVCQLPFMLDYALTGSNLPSLANCSINDDAIQCEVTISWLRNPEQTMLGFSVNSGLFESDSSIVANVQFQLQNGEYDRRFVHYMRYTCNSPDRCTDVANLKRVLDSLTLTENFEKEFAPLLVDVPTFNNISASECFQYMNSTNKPCAAPLDVDRCQRCLIAIDYPILTSNEICATCPGFTGDKNAIRREIVFNLNNRSQEFERVQLWCQMEGGCNSIENINKIRQASTIQFDFNKFFGSSSSDTNSLSMLLGFIIAFIQIKFH